MSPDEIIRFSEGVITHLENDRISFENVIKSDALVGKLGFAQIATAMAAFDLYAWILYEKYDKRVQHDQLFTELLNDKRFFDKSRYGDQRVFYSRIRCGVMHQLFPKDAGIVAKLNSNILCQDAGKLCVNAYALYCDVLDGIRKIHKHMEAMPEQEKLDLSFKLRLRAKMKERCQGHLVQSASRSAPDTVFSQRTKNRKERCQGHLVQSASSSAPDTVFTMLQLAHSEWRTERYRDT